MSLRQSFSGFRKKVKGQLSKIGDKPEGISANVSGEGSDRPIISFQPRLGIVVEDNFRGDIEVGAGEDDPGADDSRSVSGSVVGIGHDQGGSDDEASGEISQKGLHPSRQVQTESGSSRERNVDGQGANRVDPPLQSDIGTTPSPSIMRGGETESTRIPLFRSPPLTDLAGNPAVPGPILVDVTVSEDKSDWKHTAASAAKLFLRTVERASDAFPPLKSVAGGLCAILDNCEVRSTSVRSIRDAHSLRSKQRSTNK